jgi:hypothetical protein
MSMSDEQTGQRRRFAAQQKVAMLLEHFIDKVPVSQVCDTYALNLSLPRISSAGEMRPSRFDRESGDGAKVRSERSGMPASG